MLYGRLIYLHVLLMSDKHLILFGAISRMTAQM